MSRHVMSRHVMSRALSKKSVCVCTLQETTSKVSRLGFSLQGMSFLEGLQESSLGMRALHGVEQGHVARETPYSAPRQALCDCCVVTGCGNSMKEEFKGMGEKKGRSLGI